MSARSVPPPAGSSRSKLSPLVLVIAIAVLYLAKEVLIPLALALLFAFLLGPSVRRLERRGVWHVAAVTLVCSVFFLLFAAVGWIVVNQSLDLAGSLPTYKDNIAHKLHSLRGHGDSTLDKAAKAVEDINKDLQQSASDAAIVAAGPNTSSEAPGTSPRTIAGRPSDPQNPLPQPPPVAVRIIEPPHSPFEYLGSFLGPVLGPLGTAGIVVVFTIFLLLQAEDLRDRLLHLAGGSGNLSVTSQAVNEAGKRVSKYLLMQAFINAGYGVAVAIGLYFIGVPNAALWGLLSCCLRFIPYLGAWVSMAFPILLSIAVFNTWTPTIVTVVMFVGLELIVCNVVEPMLFSHSTGVNTVAVVVAATFWTWLWGPVGLLLATPLTVCIVVLGRYVPQLAFLHTLLGDEPVLSPDARFYQRLLAFDQQAVVNLTDEQLKEKPAADFYDNVLLPALGQAQIDTREGRIAEDAQQFVRQTTQTLVEDLRERPRASFLTATAAAAQANGEKPEAAAVAADAAAANGSSLPLSTRVLILPARTENDETAGQMLAHLFALDSTGAEVASSKLLVQEMLALVAAKKPELIYISAVRPFAIMQARYLCRRLRTQNPSERIIIGLWDAKEAALDEAGKVNLRTAAPADGVATTLTEAITMARDYLPQMSTAAEAAPVTVTATAAPAQVPAVLATAG